MRRFLVVLALVLSASVFESKAVPTTNGLYAVFNTTMGTYYAYLTYDLTPRTVANFVSLTEGTKGWLSYSRGTVVTQAFYNGLTFHRVVRGFVIQGGSPNGQGTDDPGYTFTNEIVATLKHDKPGVLAMANAGGIDSNGSQYYVTVSPQPGLDGLYTIFGRVVEGMNVVSNINNVATDTNSVPLVPVLTTNVSILRIGTAASNFNAAAVSPPLPVPRVKQAVYQISGGRQVMLWYGLLGYEYRICYSTDMKSWNEFYFGQFTGRYMDDFAAQLSRCFFRVVESHIDQ